MLKRVAVGVSKTRSAMKALCSNPAGFAFLPAICLGIFWFGGEMALAICAVILPVVILLTGAGFRKGTDPLPRSALTDVMRREDLGRAVAANFDAARDNGLKSAIFVIELDDGDELEQRYGRSGAEHVAEVTAQRIASTMRDNDAVCQISEFRFAICLEPVRQLDLETCIQLAGRLQSTLETAISLDGLNVHLTSSVGFCHHTQVITKSGEAWMASATFALEEAQHHGPGSIRAYSDEMRQRSKSQAELRDEVAKALELGQIRAWFQPQISTDTGLVTGFEALARWEHPTRGMISPNVFLPAIEQAGLLEKLAETMMFHAFTALKAWDKAGVTVPQVGVNFAGPELNNPKLVDKVAWELDRFDLAPERLAVEVLETVVTSAPDDVITRNINGLGTLGCRIDLDDFGTGHASIASIRRFSVSRIKIDRSFVIKADRDPDQQRMISAILTLAERLGVETLAEGVETAGEHALLSQLGCNHVQGFGIGKPMPFDQTLDWIATHTAKLQAAPKILTKRRG